MAIPVMSVRVDADLVLVAKARAEADGITWPDWVAAAFKDKLNPPTVPVSKTEQKPYPRAAQIKPSVTNGQPQADRWNAKPTCKACGAPLIAGKCGNRECK